MAISYRSAIRFVIALGLISFFADITYEGARSIAGPFLAGLGASAAVVGVVAGAGEMVGYALRLASGIAADRTRRYWALTLVGYLLNLIAVPLLACAGRWEIAAGLLILERAGKALRTPSRDVMLSQAAGVVGRGWGFGLHEAMDQAGALLGPLVVALVLARSGRYALAFAALAVPAALALLALFTARWIYPDPSRFEEKAAPELEVSGFPRAFWIYTAAAGLVAAGIADYPLIAYHFRKVSLVSPAVIPLFYSAAMGVDAVMALLWGKLFDRHGSTVIVAGVLLSAASNPLVFFGSFPMALIGIAFWGAGMGAQQSVLRAAIADLVSQGRRGSAYGVFNTVYGILWFAGSALMGLLYDRSRAGVVAFAVAAQLVAIPLLTYSKGVRRTVAA